MIQEQEMKRFKFGDKVRILSCDNVDIQPGTVGILKETVWNGYGIEVTQKFTITGANQKQELRTETVFVERNAIEEFEPSNPHSDMVRALVKNPSAIQLELTSDKVDLIHAIMGIVGEAGELDDAIKKHCIYGQKLDVKNVIEELGDLEFYMNQLRWRCNITRQQTLDANMSKLAKRYKDFQYSDQQAQQRKDEQ